MPAYAHLLEEPLDLSTLPARITALRTLGTPYPRDFEKYAVSNAEEQAKKVAANLASQGIKDQGIESKKIAALIAYLQRLGTDIKVKPADGQ